MLYLKYITLPTEFQSLSHRVVKGDYMNITSKISNFIIDFLRDDNHSFFIKKYEGFDKVVTIPQHINGIPIASIGSKAFADNKQIKIIILSDNITHINVDAFDETQYLTIYTPHQCSYIDFSHLKNVTIRYGLEKIVNHNGILYSLFNDNKAYVFDHSLMDLRFERFGRMGEMIEMETILFDRYVVEGIENFALYNAINTKMIALPKQLKWIGIQSFGNNEQLEEIILPDTLTHISNQALERCGLKRLVIPKSVTHMGYHVLSDVYNANIFLEVEETRLEWDTDWNPNQLTIYVGFRDFTVLNDIVYALLNNNKAIVIDQDLQSVKDIIIPETITVKDVTYTVTEIGTAAFFGSRYIRSVILKETIVAIRDVAFANSNLTSITLPNQLMHLGSGVFIDTFIKELIIPETIQIITKALCNHCTTLTKVTLGRDVKVIESEAFMSCFELSHINIPLTLKKVGRYALYGTSLSHVVFGYAIQEIQDLACAEMTDLESLVILNKDCEIGNPIVSSSSVRIYIEDEDTSKIYQALSQYELVKPKIFTGAYKTQNIHGVIYLITAYDVAVVIGHVEDEIDEDVFILDHIASCRVNRINSKSFYKSNKIKSITIPDGVHYVSSDFIYGCSNLQTLTLPSYLSDTKFKDIEYINIVFNYSTDDQAYINLMYAKIEAYVRKKKYMNMEEIQSKFNLKYSTTLIILDRLKKNEKVFSD